MLLVLSIIEARGAAIETVKRQNQSKRHFLHGAAIETQMPFIGFFGAPVKRQLSGTFCMVLPFGALVLPLRQLRGS